MDAKDLMRVFAYVDSSVILAHILKMLDVLAAWFNSDRGRHAKKIAPYRARVALADEIAHSTENAVRRHNISLEYSYANAG